MASYKIRTAGNCPAVLFYYHVSIHNRGDAYSILESDVEIAAATAAAGGPFFVASTTAADGTILLCSYEN